MPTTGLIFKAPDTAGPVRIQPVTKLLAWAIAWRDRPKGGAGHADALHAQFDFRSIGCNRGRRHRLALDIIVGSARTIKPSFVYQDSAFQGII